MSVDTSNWKRIPVKRLRWMHAQLQVMVSDFEAHYPGICGDDDNGEISDPQMETVRNVWTAFAEIEGWITARVQGARKDPRE